MVTYLSKNSSLESSLYLCLGKVTIVDPGTPPDMWCTRDVPSKMLSIISSWSIDLKTGIVSCMYCICILFSSTEKTNFFHWGSNLVFYCEEVWLVWRFDYFIEKEKQILTLLVVHLINWSERLACAVMELSVHYFSLSLSLFCFTYFSPRMGYRRVPKFCVGF